MHQETPKSQPFSLTPNRTPISKQRSYLSFYQNQGRTRPDVPQYQHSETPHMIEEIFQEDLIEIDQNVIWGTNISTQKIMKDFAHFIEEYEQFEGENSQGKKIYMERLEDYNLDLIDQHLFDINGMHLKEWDSDLYYQLVYFPAEMICIFDNVIQNLYKKHYVDPAEDNEKEFREKKKNLLMVAINNLKDIMLMRNL